MEETSAGSDEAASEEASDETSEEASEETAEEASEEEISEETASEETSAGAGFSDSAAGAPQPDSRQRAATRQSGGRNNRFIRFIGQCSFARTFAGDLPARYVPFAPADPPL